MSTSKDVETSVTYPRSDESIDHETEVKTTSRWRWIVGLVWDSAEGTPRNRRYVQKIDAYMFTTICLGYFIKYLDQTNYSNAFVSGMQSDMYALRFFIGLFEACAFPGYIALLGGWYGPKELTKRVAIVLEIESIASMFSGYLQAGLYTSMNGRHGIAGWRWLFIMDGVISIPIAIWGFFGIPDLPHTTKAFYLNADDRQYGIERIEKLGREPPVKLNKKVMKEVYLDWKIWVFIFPYVMVAACHTATSYFNLWLKAEGYSVVKVNTLPTAGNALAIVVTLIWGILADRTGQRYWLITGLLLLMMASNIILSVWNVPKPALMLPTIFHTLAWGHNLNAANPNLRQLLVATANIVSYAWVLWVPLVLFPTYDAPKYAYGYQILILFGGLAIVGIALMAYLYRREGKQLSEIARFSG
ncbi:hypothetical protein DID88_000640 [Monilinia fructigena]|uniref:Major facilitator superfamily (MFS) profile domain-containing protein n=1 Tax=Monilinia fructigena TaxID=38457 RepID=A0A395IJD7_9HELO|nr:hypothetical protein DID88_000640 [Monilinia fructigena]